MLSYDTIFSKIKSYHLRDKKASGVPSLVSGSCLCLWIEKLTDMSSKRWWDEVFAKSSPQWSTSLRDGLMSMCGRIVQWRVSSIALLVRTVLIVPAVNPMCWSCLCSDSCRLTGCSDDELRWIPVACWACVIAGLRCLQKEETWMVMQLFLGIYFM